MTYATPIKTGRMTVVRDGANGGSIDILGPTGTVLLSFPLDTPSGSVAGPTLTFSGFPKTAVAAAASSYASQATSARVRGSGGADVKTALTVGLTPAAAPAWVGSTSYAVGDTRTNGANQYRVVSQSGPSAASGGPTGNGQSITDGGVIWAYIAPANANVQLDSLLWALGQTVSLGAGPTMTHAA